MAKGDQSGGYMPGVYQASVNQTGQDYDNIMQQYQNLTNQAGPGNYNSSSSNSSSPQQNSLSFNPITPSTANYSAGPTFDYLQDMINTGGFSEADKGNIRARDTAATTSIYDSAQKGLNRQRSLQGGYSPGYGAASAKMARESSNQISKINTDSNANIAEMVQRGKLAGMSTLAPLQQQQNNQLNNMSQFNANATNNTNQFNAQMPLQYGQLNNQTTSVNNQAQNTDFNQILQGIQGQQSLYGTTPGLASTFGNQALNAANTVNAFPPIKNIKTGGWGSNNSNNSPWGRGN